ncbi:MAG: helix-turn-helix domain-containing protein [Candidatus Thermoplasmatota archaeon]|jgi:predicted transcriptional regulator|nr:helix-turn-helix domain-containing protein [Candidatus Thermoplasmatota archaeon]MCL5963769.1 helix-turn-helix domain-containing protein [Candidatus Thermoplasmatota archaeon]
MKFEIVIKDVSSITSSNIEDAVIDFIYMIGLISKSQRYNREKIKKSIPYRLFMDFFLKYPGKPWQVSDLATTLGTSRPTVYRYINKLMNMDFIEVENIDDLDTSHKGAVKKGYRIRFGNIEKAWGIVDAHIKIIIRNYEESAKYIQSIVDKDINSKRHL